MLPKPFGIIPKVRLQRMASRMTLIIGIDCRESLLFCADREESTELGGTRSVSKIHEAWGSNWSMGIATAGSGPIGDIAATRIITEAKAHETFNSTPAPIIENVLSAIYQKYIFPRDEKRQSERNISLIVGIHDSENKQRFLFKTFEEIVKPEYHYACAGVGLDIAYYFLDRLYGDGMTGGEARILSAFILREAKSSVGGVGKGSEFVQIVHSGEHRGIHHRSLISEAVDWQEVPQLSQCLTPFWKVES
jgi:20S proteasome alpha/beta subunit